MPIIAHKWKAQWGCSVIEKFHFTTDGHHSGIVNSAVLRPDFTWYEGRIMLIRGTGEFFVEWSIGMPSGNIKNTNLKDLRNFLVDYLDGVRTHSDISDVETWDLFIMWSGFRSVMPQKVRIKRDGEGKMLRCAQWDEQRKTFVPSSVPYVNVTLEPYSDARWKEALTDAAIHANHKKAEQTCHSVMSCFSLSLHEPVLLRVMKEQTRMFDKHRKIVEAKYEELQRKEKEKKDSNS